VAYVNGVPAAYITYYFTYSTFLAKPTFFLEDIFVLEEFRRHGLGSKLFHHCREVADKEGCGRMEWAVLDWNVDAQAFYQKLGGTQLPWYFYRITL
jgi:GNAT superfamily N-acetyltransferase